MVKMEYKEAYACQDLVEIVRILRAPGGCPWDAEQTHSSIRRNMIEEAHEAAEAIDLCDGALLCEELGDLLLQVVFQAEIAAGGGRFTIDDVTTGICRKLIYRHPHVFGDLKVSGSEEVLANWDKLKRQSKGHDSAADAMKAVSRALPGLMRLQKILGKAEKAPTLGSDAWTSRLLQLAQDANAAGVDLETEADRACRQLIEQANA